MSWEDRTRGFNIDKMYWASELENSSLLPKRLISFGRGWIEKKNRKSLYLVGGPGCGKTHFSVALLRGLFERNEFGLFVKSGDLDLELLQAAREGHEFDVLRKYSEADVLFIDDLGVERDSDRMTRQFYQIIDKRIGNGFPTVINSNLEKTDVSPDPRVISRLEFAVELRFPLKDLRKVIQIQ